MRALLRLGQQPIFIQTIAGLGVLVVAGLLLHQLLREKLLETAQARLHDHAALLSLAIHENLQERQRDLALLARLPGTGDAMSDSAQRRALLRRLRDAYRWPGELALLDVHGATLASTGPEVHASAAESTWFRQALERSTVREEDSPGGQARPSLVIAVPLKIASGATVGVLATKLESGWLARLVQETIPPSEDELTISVSDAAGQRVYQQAGALLDSKARTLLARRDVEPQDGGAVGWQVEIGQTRAAALALLREVEALLIGAGIVGTLVMVLAGVYAALRLVFPLARLAAAAKRGSSNGTALALDWVGGGSDVQAVVDALRALDVRAAGAEAERCRLEQLVADRAEELDAVYEHSPVGLHTLRVDGLVLQMNARELGWLGYSAEEVVGRRYILEFTASDYASVFEERMKILRNGDTPPNAYTELIRKDGSRMPVRVSSTPVMGRDGTLTMIRSAVMDLTQTSSREAREEDSRRLEHELLAGISSGLFLYREDGQCVYANEAAAKMVGTTVETVLEQNFHFLLSWRKSGLYAATLEALEGKASEVLVQSRSSFGKAIDSLIQCVPVRRGDAPMALLIASDVSNLAANARAMEKLAYVDALTELPNRRAAMERLDAEFRRARRTASPWSVLMVDVDHFKRVNDSFGHDVGDLVLRHVAKTLKSGARNTDFVARLGGEEFLVLLPDTSLADSRVVAEKLRAALESSAAPQVGRITASFGLAGIAPGDTGVEALLKRADLGVYRAKAEGRNRVAEAQDSATAGTPAPHA